MHNVYFVQYDVPVSFLAQVLDTGTYFFHCIFSGFWRFMPQILYMIQGHILGEITDLEFENH